MKKVLNAGTNGTYNYEHEPKDDSLCQVLQKACLEQLLGELQDVIVDVAIFTSIRSITMVNNSSEFAFQFVFVCAFMGVSENAGTPKSSILVGFSIINHPFWGTPIFGNNLIDFFEIKHSTAMQYVQKKSQDGRIRLMNLELLSHLGLEIAIRNICVSVGWLVSFFCGVL